MGRQTAQPRLSAPLPPFVDRTHASRRRQKRTIGRVDLCHPHERPMPVPPRNSGSSPPETPLRPRGGKGEHEHVLAPQRDFALSTQAGHRTDDSRQQLVVININSDCRDRGCQWREQAITARAWGGRELACRPAAQPHRRSRTTSAAARADHRLGHSRAASAGFSSVVDLSPAHHKRSSPASRRTYQ